MTSDKPKTDTADVPRGRRRTLGMRHSRESCSRNPSQNPRVCFFPLILYVRIHKHISVMYMPGVSGPFVGLSSDLISFRIAAYSRLVRPCKLQGWKLDWLALTARVRDGAAHVRSDHCCTRYIRVRCTLDIWYMRARLREKENPSENASASNRRASNRTRRGARQPADTIVTGCINPPSWYPQGRASNPKVNALDSTSAALRLLRFVVDFFFWTFPASSLSPLSSLPLSLSFSVFSFFFFSFLSLAGVAFLSLSLAGEMENLIWPRAGCHCH